MKPKTAPGCLAIISGFLMGACGGVCLRYVIPLVRTERYGAAVLLLMAAGGAFVLMAVALAFTRPVAVEDGE